MVADPFELECHVVQRQQEAEIAGDRRLGRDRHRDDVGDLALGVVHGTIAVDDRPGGAEIALDERPDAAADLRLDERAHPQDPVLDRPFLAVESAPRDGGEGLPRRA